MRIKKTMCNRCITAPRVARCSYCLDCRRIIGRERQKQFYDKRRLTPEGREIIRKQSLKKYQDRKVNNPESIKMYSLRRIAHLRKGDVTSEQLRQKWERYDGRCAYCRAQLTPSRQTFSRGSATGFDHVRLLSAGGLHTINNMVPCCLPCNRLKGWMTDDEQRVERKPKKDVDISLQVS